MTWDLHLFVSLTFAAVVVGAVRLTFVVGAAGAPGRVPTCFETWDGDEGAITIKQCLGNGLCAYFAGLCYDQSREAYELLIDT